MSEKKDEKAAGKSGAKAAAKKPAQKAAKKPAAEGTAKGTALSFRSLSGSMMGFMDRRLRGEPADQGFFRERDGIGSVEDDDDPDAKPN